MFGFQLTVFGAIACYVSLLTADGHSLFGAVIAALTVAIGAHVSTPKANIQPIVQLSE